MQNTVLILGPAGRLGRHAAHAFEAAGWKVRRFDRSTDTLRDAARGMAVIVNGWNPSYPDWASQVPDQTDRIIEAAKANGATVIVPGNVYVYGAEAPERFAADTPHLATNPLGRIRVEMEAAYRASGVQTFVVRAGDFLDTRASGNWFDAIITKPLAKGRISYPGLLDVPHAFTFLPDVAATMVTLAEQRDRLASFEDVPVSSHTLTALDLARLLTKLLGRPITAKSMAWWPLRLAGVVWPMGRALVEMRYLWDKPHWIDADRHGHLCPQVRVTPLDEALSRATQFDIDPDQTMRSGLQPVVTQ